MKKIVVTLLLAAILLAMTPMSATLAEASYATVQSGNQYGVRLRLGPSTSYASQTTLPSGTVVTVLEKGTVWTRIQAGTLSGYMMSKFLVSSSGSSSPALLRWAPLPCMRATACARGCAPRLTAAVWACTAMARL